MIRGVIDNYKNIYNNAFGSVIGSMKGNKKESVDMNKKLRDEEYKQDAITNSVLYQAKTENVHQRLKAYTSNNAFWSIVEKQEIAHHQPIVHNVVERYVSIVVNNYKGYKVDDLDIELEIDKIFSYENSQELNDIIEDITRSVLVYGDACVKIEYDSDISDEPIVSVIDGLYVDYEVKKGRIYEAIFTEKVEYDDIEYILKEYRGRGYINYKLFNQEGDEVPLSRTPYTENLLNVQYEGPMLAIPIRFKKHPIINHRGKPLFYGKIDMLSRYDEAGSKANTILRKSEPYTLFNEKVVSKKHPINSQNAKGFNVRDYYYQEEPVRGKDILVFNNDMKKDGEMPTLIDHVSIDPHAKEYETFKNMFLDDVLLGVMSPETLGIESKSIDENFKAQRDREQITIDNANSFINKLTYQIKYMINLTLFFKNLLKYKEFYKENDIDVMFTEYGSSSTEERIELVSKIKPLQGNIISQYRLTEMMFPEFSEEEIREEIDRINFGESNENMNDFYSLEEKFMDDRYRKIIDEIEYEEDYED